MAAAARPPTAIPAIAPVERSLTPLADRVPFALSAAPAALASELDDEDDVDCTLEELEVGVTVVKAVTTTTPVSDVEVEVREGGAGGEGGALLSESVGGELELVEVEVEVEVDVDVVGGTAVLRESEYSVSTGTVRSSTLVTVTMPLIKDCVLLQFRKSVPSFLTWPFFREGSTASQNTLKDHHFGGNLIFLGRIGSRCCDEYSGRGLRSLPDERSDDCPASDKGGGGPRAEERLCRDARGEDLRHGEQASATLR